MIEEISEGDEEIKFGDRKLPIRQFAAAFALKGAAQTKPVGVLSGGERNRVHLAKVLKKGHNVLFLDEPTNDLDVHTLRSLENALQDFPGTGESWLPPPHLSPLIFLWCSTAVVISHDRWFLDRICTHVLVFDEEHKAANADPSVPCPVEFFPGNFSEYREHKSRMAQRKPTAAVA